ncbi:hypothetical protein ACQP00_31610 [Dactylosporangium sp. CS-047395]|uniref:hypothetical protein n=1 Tax=Dactylosporangium sp. CS-047395 TaxID=3239936 RepID=UPI003D8B4578
MAANDSYLPAAAGFAAPGGLTGWLSGSRHRTAVNLFMVVVLAHWAEHVAQAFEIYVLGWKLPAARGVLGLPFPWLIKSEWMHYGYALIMILALWFLRAGFHGRAKTWWMVAFGIQFWHHIEHLLLLLQAQTGHFLFGKAVPTSVLQLVFPRVELHLFYNTIVTIPMVIAMYYHLRPNKAEQQEATCTCAPESRPLASAGV